LINKYTKSIYYIGGLKMPLPNPKSNESEKDFIGRCISDISKEKDGKGNKR
jgi:hypothetical protein